MADPSDRSTALEPFASKAPSPGAPVDAGRRELLASAALGCAGGAAALAVWPLAAGALSIEEGDEGSGGGAQAPYLDVAAESDVRAGSPLLVPLRAAMRDGWSAVVRDLGGVWLLRTPGGIAALSAACPHLGCGIQEAPKGFSCPCHESRFDGLGNHSTGPSPRGLDPLPVRVERGRVLVQALRFEPGGKTRRAL